MELEANRRGSKFSSFERVAAISLVVLAVASPLYIDHRSESELEDDEQPISVTLWLPMLLFVLVLVISLSAFLDKSFTRFDRNWIHRVGVLLVVLFSFLFFSFLF
ncbi:transmembrane protein, putative [Medicago truncatula]|uniref:Transmembrane protein, putative n=1 Tax=Medicago truncatula TaxID=3880 RepID=G7I919_MEDTR|nr:transmembrane protein, putative [Medicago truncatula]